MKVHWQDRQTGDLIFIDVEEPWGVVDHVGIVYRPDPYREGEVIHATNSTRRPDNAFSNIESGRSVVHEHFTWRRYWRTYFVDLGRLPGR